MSLLAIPFPNFVNGTAADATQVDANNAAIIAWANGGIDNTNVGAAGFFASQIKPTTSGQGIFGGAGVAYTFQSQLSIAPASNAVVALTVNEAVGGASDIVDFQLGGVNKVWLDNSANLKFAAGPNLFGNDLHSSTGSLFFDATTTSGTINSATAGAHDGLILNSSGSPTGNVLSVQYNGVTKAWLDASPNFNWHMSGGLVASAFVQAGAGTGPGLTAGDVGASRNTTSGGVVIGGSVTNGLLDFGVTHAGTFTMNSALAFAFGAAAGIAQVSIGNDGGATNGLTFNVPTGSTNGYTFNVNTGAVARIDRFGNIFPGNPNSGIITGPYITTGTGSPNGVVTAANGSIFLRFDGGSASLVLYVNNSGASTSGTTWTAVTVP